MTCLLNIYFRVYRPSVLPIFASVKTIFVPHKFFEGNEVLLLNKQPKIKYRLIKGLEGEGSVFWLAETRNRSPKSHFLSKHPPPTPTQPYCVLQRCFFESSVLEPLSNKVFYKSNLSVFLAKLIKVFV